ncbi:ABC transporter permease [bacterium]|nr:ABC transporter permease [bacterium]
MKDSQKAIRADHGFRSVLRRLFKRKSAILGLVIIIILSITGIFGPFLAPHDPELIYKGYEKQSPGTIILKTEIDKEFEFATRGAFKYPFLINNHHSIFLMGTDDQGRDLFSRLLFGARVSLLVGIVAEIIALLIGIVVGGIAGFYGGRIDSILMRITDIFFAFPSLLLAIGILAIFEKPGLWNIFFALGVVGWTQVARIVRGQVLTVKEEEFVEAARAIGANDFRILIRHILPNTIAPLIVIGTLGIAWNILSEAGLSFLGLGVQPPAPSWGNMLTDARSYINSKHYFICIIPGLAIVFTVLGFNLLGDGLRDSLDPRMKKGAV